MPRMTKTIKIVQVSHNKKSSTSNRMYLLKGTKGKKCNVVYNKVKYLRDDDESYAFDYTHALIPPLCHILNQNFSPYFIRHVFCM